MALLSFFYTWGTHNPEGIVPHRNRDNFSLCMCNTSDFINDFMNTEIFDIILIISLETVVIDGAITIGLIIIWKSEIIFNPHDTSNFKIR